MMNCISPHAVVDLDDCIYRSDQIKTKSILASKLHSSDSRIRGYQLHNLCHFRLDSYMKGPQRSWAFAAYRRGLQSGPDLVVVGRDPRSTTVLRPKCRLHYLAQARNNDGLHASSFCYRSLQATTIAPLLRIDKNLAILTGHACYLKVWS